jgi:hypothetical protein
MKLANVDGFSFDFTDALDAFVFDEKDKTKTTFHGLPMKAVDIIVELKTAYLFIEIKKYDDPADFDTKSFTGEDELKEKRLYFRWLKNYLKYKYRDSYLFRHAENKADKPIHYLCLINFENALNITLQKSLRQELPVGKASRRWKRKIVHSVHVLNLTKWNQRFPAWPVVPVSGVVS